MPRKQKRTRVYGPYQHRQRWRLVLRTASGPTVTQSFETERAAIRGKQAAEQVIAIENAWARVEQLERELATAQADARSGGNSRTVREVIEAYLSAREGEIKTGTLEMYRTNFVAFLSPVLDEPLASITSTRAAALYRDQTATTAAATHQSRLQYAKLLWAWAAEPERRWAAEDVWTRIKPIGKRKRGKRQPRRSEAEKLYHGAFERAELEDGSIRSLGALAVITQILLGVRSEELVTARGRDIDSGCWYVEDSKTDNGIRTVEIPARLLPLLERRAKKVGPDGRLFPRSPCWPRSRAKALCAELGIPPYGAHAMRGLHSSIARAAGATSHLVAATLGHGSTAVTERHYISEEVQIARRSAERREFFDDLEQKSRKMAGNKNGGISFPPDFGQMTASPNSDVKTDT